MSMSCNLCELQGKYVGPIINEKSNLLLLVDYPSPRDDERGVIFSALDHRAQTFFDALSLAKLDSDDVNIAAALRCVIKSKDIRTSLITDCATRLLETMPHVEKILCYGVATYCFMTGLPIKQVDEYRKDYTTMTIAGKERLIGCTYSLSLVGSSGCSACARGTYTVLMAKDIKRIRKHTR